MRIDIKQAILHEPLFVAGKNLAKAPHLNANGGKLVMQYDTVLQCLIVQYNGATSMVPAATVASMELKDPAQIAQKAKSINGKPEGLESPAAAALKSAMTATVLPRDPNATEIK